MIVFGSLTPHYPSDYSVLMALVDLVPVALFFVAGIFLLKDLHNKLGKAGYALVSTGIVLVLIAGTFKAIWKILMALAICDFVVFNLMMMPLQAIGFTLASIGLFELMKTHKYTKAACVALPALLVLFEEAPLPFYNTTMPFLILQTIAASVMTVLLCIVATKMKNKLALILLIVSFVAMWGMGGLAATQDKMSTTLWNWLEELDNSVTQGALLAAVLVLHKHGLGEEKIYVK